MTELQKQLREKAELAVSNGECGAQLEIKDTVLREALLEAVYRQLHAAWQMGWIAK